MDDVVISDADIKRLLETIRDDAFEVGLENLLSPDLPFDAYWDDEEGGGGGYTGQAPIWWPLNIYALVHKHPFWQGKFPHHKAKRRAYSKSPVERTVRTRETTREQSPIAVNDDQTILELLLMGDL